MNGIRYSLRALARTPVVSLVVVLSLALGIGANTAIFSLLHQILLRSLPVDKPEELVVLTSPGDFKGGRNSTNNSGGMDYIFSYPMFRGFERNHNGLKDIAGYRLLGANISFQGKTLDGGVEVVSGGFFPTLNVQPLMGRMISYDDDKGAGQPVAVLSFGYWQDRLGSRPDVLNQPMRVNGQVFTIVGVAPKGFTGVTLGDEPDVFVPLVFKPAMTPGWDGRDKWNDFWIYSFARLAPGTSREQAQSAINGAYTALLEEQIKVNPGRDENYRKRFRASRMKLEPGSLGQSETRDYMKTPLLVLIICTGLVLLIAAANAANLLLARAAQRNRELSIRSALGAGKMQIMGQLLTEAMLLSVAGGVVGIILGSWVLDLLISGINDPETNSYSITAHLDPKVLLFSVVIALLTGILFGLYPAWSAARNSVSGVLKEDSNNSSASRGGVRVRKALVMAQVAISLLLLIPMGLFLKSLVNLLHENLGLKTENVVSFRLSPDLNGYKPDRCRQLFERAEQELAAVPGFSSVATSMVPLISGSNWGNNITVEGYSKEMDDNTHSMFNAVGPGFFGKMGVALVSGREISDSDTLASPQVAVVNETWARHFFKDASPLGRHFKIGGGDKTPLNIEIVGVVKDSKYSGVRQKVPRIYYIPYRQDKEPGSLSFYVRSPLPTDQVSAQIRRVISGMDPDLPIESLRTLDDQVQRNIRSDKLVMQLASAFAILATLLAMLGLYGVMAFNVARRTREIGIRMALGAGSSRIRSLVLREVTVVLAIGTIFGVPCALGLARLAESQLFGVKANDPIVVFLAIVALAIAAMAAGYLPARRATRINPVEALRYE